MVRKVIVLVGILAFNSYLAFSQTLQEKAESGDMVAQYEYAKLLSGKLIPTEEDLSEAFKWLTLSAEQGYAPAQCNLGDCYFKGQGTRQNYEKAVYWFKKSAVQGNMVGKS